jgi:hypothetical protein
MSSTVAAYDLRSLYTKLAIDIPGHGAWDGVKVGRPSAAGVELMEGFVERCIASGTSVDTGGWRVLIVLASKGFFGFLLTENAELL